MPWRRKWQPIPVFLPGESHGQRSLAGQRNLAGYSPWGLKESDMTKQLDNNNKICCEFFCPLAVLVDRSHSMFVKGCLRQHVLGPKS